MKKSARIRRYYAVMSDRSTVVHIAHSIVEGARTECGRILRMGWHWAHKPKRSAKRCVRCYGSRSQRRGR